MFSTQKRLISAWKGEHPKGITELRYNMKRDMSEEEDIEREVIIGWIEDREAYIIYADKILEGKEPYFKFYDSDELETSEHVARISFTRVGYIEGGEDGLPGFRLNKDQVRAMVEFFEGECQEENYRECRKLLKDHGGHDDL